MGVCNIEDIYFERSFRGKISIFWLYMEPESVRIHLMVTFNWIIRFRINFMYCKKLAQIIFSIFILTLIPYIAHSQYFGRNKVQYEDFDFQILHTRHFDIYHYPKEAKAVRDLGKLSERWYLRHSRLLNHTFKTKNPLIIYANHADFQQTDVISRISIGTGGVTEGRRNRVVMPFAEANKSTNHVLGHELVHAFQYDIARQSEIGGIRAMSQMPLWFVEGMAEYLSIGPKGTHTAMWLRDAVLNDDMPGIKDLTNSSEYFPYRYGHSVWAYIAGRWGDDRVGDLFVSSAKNGLGSGFKKILGLSIDSVSTLWENAVKGQYADDVKKRNTPSEVGELKLGKEKNTGSINIGPSLSPNGEYVAFISEKNLFSIELFLADAETGKIIKKLTSTNADPHLNALRFIESSGSWSPDSKRFAAVVFAKGDNQIAIIDVENGGIKRRFDFGEVDAITNPAWSPDGKKIAFAGSDGGYTDLYIYNLETDSLRNVTKDPYSDLQPAWSPDGSAIAFVTDRGTGTDLDNLVFGNMKIAVMDVSSGEMEMIPEFFEAKHINPQFSPDGHSLYYISDYEGFSDIYRFDFQTGKRYRVTSVSTGISGISEYSPAITVAQNTGELMATVFDKSNYSIYQIPEEEKRGKQMISLSQIANSNMLPSMGSSGNQRMLTYLNDPLTDLPPETSFGLSDYTPKLSLTNISGGGGIGVSGQFGVGAAGGVNLLFSDMLRQHLLFSTIRLQGSFKDIGGQVGYFNRDNRFIWGGSVSHFAFRTSRTGISRNDTTTVDGEEVVAPASVVQLNQRIFRERVSALGMYPLSRTQRFEFSAGYSHIWYDFEREQTFLTGTGRPFKRETFDASLREPSPLNLASISAAYVEDNSISAFTGPIRGHRLRFEVEPTTGSLTFMQALADYRRYFYLEPFTLGFRALHSARYFGDAESERLSPEFLGYESLIRGYNTASFSATECSASPGEGCAVFNRLIGSKIGVANVELRLPVLGAEQLALFRSRTVPTTLTAFFDGGVAWTRDNPPELRWTTDNTADNIPVFSTGLSTRVNILGYLIAEVYYAVPFQRPEKGGYVGFQISPGW